MAGGHMRPDLGPAFVEPTILTDVTPEMRAYREELFGPAAVVYKVSSEEEAVRREELQREAVHVLVAAAGGDFSRGGCGTTVGCCRWAR